MCRPPRLPIDWRGALERRDEPRVEPGARQHRDVVGAGQRLRDRRHRILQRGFETESGGVCRHRVGPDSLLVLRQIPECVLGFPWRTSDDGLRGVRRLRFRAAPQVKEVVQVRDRS